MSFRERNGWSDPPLTEPPIDHEPAPKRKRLNPLKKGAAAALVFIALVTLSPLIIVGVLIWLWWEALLWATS